jgi:hypothetical protein
MPDVHTVILVSENLVTFPDNESPEWPLTVADRKLATARVVNIGQRPDKNFRLRHAV